MIKELLNRMESEMVWEKKFFLQRNDYLKVHGTIDTNLYFIQSGSLKISLVSGDEEFIIRFGYKHDIITALDSFITEKTSDIQIQALRKTTIKMTNKIRLMNFIQSREENKDLWSKILELLILQQFEREMDIMVTSPKKRYERVLKRSPQLFQEIPNKHIASYLRMTPETLSRLKKS